MMRKLPESWTAAAAPLLVDNVDTDTIIPSREMRSTGRTGLADGLFAPWRYLDADSRTENPDFVLNKFPFRDTTILLGGGNFGCGSSREHAVWALAEWGIFAILAESFAPIFQGNCIRNGILPATISRAALKHFAGEDVTIDLAGQKVSAAGETCMFEIEPEARLMLLEGLDAIDLTLKQADVIAAWNSSDRARRPWVYLEKSA
ncbi:MAG: 3-isopropylmalate dehydratase small subunit [Sphingomonadaceae bacterium]